MRWARHLLSADDLRKRAEDLQKLRRKKPRRQPKKAQSNTPKRPRRNRYSVRTDSGPVALQAFWGMHIEAMNWSGMGHAEYAAALGLSPHALRIWRDRLEQSGNEMDWRSLLHPSARAQLSSAANCARRKYRLTPEAADGRSNRRRFSDEQKRAIVQETEKPGASVAQVCRRHGVATSMLFRWRVDFGLSAQKAPQVVTVALSEGAANEPSALAVLRELWHWRDSVAESRDMPPKRVLRDDLLVERGRKRLDLRHGGHGDEERDQPPDHLTKHRRTP